MPATKRAIFTILVYLWAFPYTAIGLIVGLSALGRARFVDGVVEISGPGVAWLLARLPLPASAITLGHCVLGQTVTALNITRKHERVHVRQYERWGPLMGIVYLAFSARLWFQGKDPYRDNPFEVEAYAVDDCTSNE